MHPVVTVNPFPVRVALGIPLDRVSDLVRRRIGDADIELIGVARREGKVRVRVHVVQPRHHEGPFEIEHTRVRTDQGRDIVARTERDEPSIADRRRLRPWAPGIDRVDDRVRQYPVRQDTGPAGMG